MSGQAGFVALLCAIGQLAAASHLVLVRHAACPEHGDLLHGGAVHGQRHSGADQGSPAFRAGAVGDGDEEHDHCSLACDRRKLAIAAMTGCVLAAQLSGAQACPVRFARGKPGVPLFRLAPKQSPPAV